MTPPSASPDRDPARRRRRETALALRAEQSPAGPAPDQLRVATWNLNSLRRRLPAVERFVQRAAPDVLCLQETKAARLSAWIDHVERGAEGPSDHAALLADFDQLDD